MRLDSLQPLQPFQQVTVIVLAVSGWGTFTSHHIFNLFDKILKG